MPNHQHAPRRSLHVLTLAVTAAGMLAGAPALADPTLEGWALMPAATTAVGPTTGQFGGSGFGANSSLLPLANAQSVQGFSAVLRGPKRSTYYVMPDNGFGTKGNSADALLRMYAVRPDFRRWQGNAVVGRGVVEPVGFRSGERLRQFGAASFIGLRDPDFNLDFKIQADFDHYYDTPTNPAVDPSIKSQRLLTGADFDIEAVRRDHRGNLWFGDEFGPFLVKTDATGKVLRSEIPLPNIKPADSTSAGAFVQSPQNPFLNGVANLGGSRGFEGMAINPAGTKLYTLLEGTVTGDAAKSLRIDEFDVDHETYTGHNFLYKLDADGTNIGDMTAVNDHEFLVIERNGNTATSGGVPYKRIFLIDVAKLDADGFVTKTPLVDLMNVADPHDLNGDGSIVFTFPYVTIEDVLIVDAHTLLVINDNNFPGGGGRNAAPDATEFLTIHLDTALAVARDDDEDRAAHDHERGER